MSGAMGVPMALPFGLVVFCFSENRLSMPEDMTILSPAFKLVSVLNINKMSLQWEEVYDISASTLKEW